MNISALTRSTPYTLIKATISEWVDDGALRLSAALAYYSVFSIAPLLIIAVTIAGWAFGPDAVQGHLAGQLSAYIGAQAAEAVQSMVKSASSPDDTLLGGIIGGATLVLAASGIFGQLKDALNTIWDVKPKTGQAVMGFILARVLSLSMVLVIGFLLLISLLLTTVATAASGYLGRIFVIPPQLLSAAAFVISFTVVTILFAFIYKVLPDAKIQWRHVWVGAVITAILFEIGRFGLSFYLGRQSTVSSFGAAGSLVLLLMWVYYASCILLLGAEFTQVYAKSRGHVTEAEDDAEKAHEKTSPGMSEGEKDTGGDPAPILVPSPSGFKVIETWSPGSAAYHPESSYKTLRPLAELAAVTAATYALGVFLRRVK